jgi:hypothetical protein
MRLATNSAKTGQGENVRFGSNATAAARTARLQPVWVESRPFQFHGTDVRRGYEAENCAPGRPISQLCMGDYENPPMQPESDAYGALALAIGGGFQVPSRIEGGVSFGQYSRSMGMNLPLCVVGSQFDSFAAPGELACR